MLTFQEKVDICLSFPELTRKDVSLGRVNFAYEASAVDKKVVVYHLHPNGNGFLYAGLIEGVPVDEKGFVNIRDISEEELRSLIARSIRSLGYRENIKAAAVEADGEAESRPDEQRWIGPDQQELLIHYEDELWYIYAGMNLEVAFETWEETEEYLQEEGFAKA